MTAAAPRMPRPRLGAYEPLLELASGGMATVYVARHSGAAGFERLVVLKRVHTHLLADRDFTNMFRDEARLASQIRHPNVVSVIDVVEEGRELFLVMDYIESVSLSTLLRRVVHAQQRLPPPVAARIVCDTLAGLHAAHEAVDMRGMRLDVVHRDVSPQNIIVGVDGASRLIDFGIAKAAHRITETRSGSVKGKIGYMAPEAAQGARVDRRADVYATGVVLFEALTARRLFQGDNDLETLRKVTEGVVPDVTSIVPGLPAAIDIVVRRAVARDPNERFQTALEFLAALERTLALAPPREVGLHLESYCGDRLNERRVELRERLEGRADSVRLVPLSDPPDSLQSGYSATGPIEATRVEGTERRIATSSDALDRRARTGRGAVAIAIGVIVMLSLAIVLVLALGKRGPATAAQPGPSASHAAAMGEPPAGPSIAATSAPSSSPSAAAPTATASQSAPATSASEPKKKGSSKAPSSPPTPKRDELQDNPY